MNIQMFPNEKIYVVAILKNIVVYQRRLVTIFKINACLPYMQTLTLSLGTQVNLLSRQKMYLTRMYMYGAH